ncbi:MAG: SDR family NAD(P)-dependent oxidoreductase, partial [Bacilli bacterium]
MVKGKVAFVTGGSRGIGREIALALAEEGAHVVVNYVSSEQKAQEVVAEIESYGVKGLALQGDVSDESSVQAMVDKIVETFDRLDILVNNAGITRDTLLMRMKTSDWESVMDTNLKGVFLTTKAVSRTMMKQRSGRIINISSIVGINGSAGQAN